MSILLFLHWKWQIYHSRQSPDLSLGQCFSVLFDYHCWDLHLLRFTFSLRSFFHLIALLAAFVRSAIILNPVFRSRKCDISACSYRLAGCESFFPAVASRTRKPSIQGLFSSVPPFIAGVLCHCWDSHHLLLISHPPSNLAVMSRTQAFHLQLNGISRALRIVPM